MSISCLCSFPSTGGVSTIIFTIFFVVSQMTFPVPLPSASAKRFYCACALGRTKLRYMYALFVREKWLVQPPVETMITATRSRRERRRRERDTSASSSNRHRHSSKASAPSASRSFASRTSSTVVDTASVPRASSESEEMASHVRTVISPGILPWSTRA